MLYPKPPSQEPITHAKIQQMLSWAPRRFRLADIDPVLKPPDSHATDWNLVFPFRETFVPAFESACSVEHLNFMSKGQQTFCYTFLKNVSQEKIQALQTWLSTIHQVVAIRDCLALSFALDYDRMQGSPNMPRTEIGTLRSQAKPYDAHATAEHIVAAKELGRRCLNFLGVVGSYNSATAVVSVPSSDPTQGFSVPTEVAQVIAEGSKLQNLSTLVRTTRPRPGLKNLPVSEKLKTIQETIAVHGDLRGQNILLVDDLYQSGVTMNCVAMKLIEAGAKAVYGLACEKTCRNDANVSEVE
ncbi:MAG: hypothetical protein JRF33_23430 [Deltaproteobacteria bacterium]|nr:hypothetical protein [Deltaproteobacteria bacterium]